MSDTARENRQYMRNYYFKAIMFDDLINFDEE